MGTNADAPATAAATGKSSEKEELPDPGPGFRWAPTPDGKGQQLVADAMRPARGKKAPPPFNVKNTGKVPLVIWNGPRPLVQPGQVVAVPAEHRLAVLQDLARGRYAGGRNEQTGEEWGPTLVRTDEKGQTDDEFLEASMKNERGAA